MFKTARFERRPDHLVVEAPFGLGARERLLLDHYRRIAPGTFVFLVRGWTPEIADAGDSPLPDWGDDTW